MSKEDLRRLPQIERALQWPRLRAQAEASSRDEVTACLRHVLDELRAGVLAGRDALPAEETRLETLISDRTEAYALSRELSGYRRAINGTGILLHTGLGRTPLPQAAQAAFVEHLGGYSLVEVDAESGLRNQREAALAELLGELTGAEAALVVNNNAAATLLILAALARGREVIVSRGQLVEIGGSYRVPDILAESGARLVEVGTTNRTYVRDYSAAITAETGLLLAVHTSNYAIRGFVHETPLAELVALGETRRVPVVSDLGSGCFVDLSCFGFDREPLVTETVATGADLVCFSGDKLLGGPQAGIIVGKAEQVARVRAHPLYRAMRCDKVTLTLLEATLRLYRDPARLFESIPALRLITTPADIVRERADAFVKAHAASRGRLRVECVESRAATGSGSLPDQSIASYALRCELDGASAEELARRLRTSRPVVFPRIADDRVLIDFRTVLPEDEAELREVLGRIGAD